MGPPAKWVAGVMYIAGKVNPFSVYVALVLYWVLPVSAYLLLFYRSHWMARVHGVLRLSIFGVIGFFLSVAAVEGVGYGYLLILSHALKTSLG